MAETQGQRSVLGLPERPGAGFEPNPRKGVSDHSDLTRRKKQTRSGWRLVTSVFERPAPRDRDHRSRSSHHFGDQLAFSEITGYLPPRKRSVRKSHPVRPGTTQRFSKRYGGTEQDGKWHVSNNAARTARWFLNSLSISAVKDRAGCVTHYVGVLPTSQAMAIPEQQPIFLAHHDPLTELPNRILFNDRLTQGILQSATIPAWPCCSSIWTTSRISTIPWAISLAINCRKWWLRNYVKTIAPATRWQTAGGDENSSC